MIEDLTARQLQEWEAYELVDGPILPPAHQLWWQMQPYAKHDFKVQHLRMSDEWIGSEIPADEPEQVSEEVQQQRTAQLWRKVMKVFGPGSE